VLRLLVIANVVPSSPILAILMMEGRGFFETSVLAGAARRNIAEDVIYVPYYVLKMINLWARMFGLVVNLHNKLKLFKPLYSIQAVLQRTRKNDCPRLIL
jgi:hypothetical protein